MQERKHKYGKNNRLRIAAGLPPIIGTNRPAPLQPEAAPAPAQSVLAIQAAAIEELQTAITELQCRVDDMREAYMRNLTMRPTEKK